jgi:hypothetical protein
MIIDKRNPEVLRVKPVTVPLVHHKPHVICPAMHTEQTPLGNIVYFAPISTLLVITRTVSLAKYIAGLIVCLRNIHYRFLRSKLILGNIFGKQNTNYEAGITIDRDLLYKIYNK